MSNQRPEFQEIKISEIAFKQNNRVSLRENSFLELMESIKTQGLMQPVEVTKLPKAKSNGKKYELVFGHRRFHACKKLGFTKINARVQDYSDSPNEDAELQALVRNIGENVHREDINLYELGSSCHKMMENFEMTPREVAMTLNCGLSRVQSALNTFSRVPDEFKKKVSVSPYGAKTQKPGTVPATISNCIINMQRKYDLGQDKIKRLFKVAASDNTMSQKKMSTLMGLLDQDVDFDNALEILDDLVVLMVPVVVTKEDREKLTEHGITLQDLGKFVYNNPKFNLEDPCDLEFEEVEE